MTDDQPGNDPLAPIRVVYTVDRVRLTVDQGEHLARRLAGQGLHVSGWACAGDAVLVWSYILAIATCDGHDPVAMAAHVAVAMNWVVGESIVERRAA